jgi:hypothetical protein
VVPGEIARHGVVPNGADADLRPDTVFDAEDIVL